METLCIAAGRIAFHSANAHQPEKRIPVKPALRLLRLECLEQIVNLLFVQRSFDRHVDIGTSEITVILWDLIFEDQMIPEGVPRQLGEQPMILVRISAPMRKD